MNPKLSICIPTYNRCEILKDSINEIIPILVDKNIEICISNNSSTDNTHEYIQSLIKLYPVIKYKRQLRNVGIDQNMMDVMLMATGEFILPLGDDDKIIVENIDKEILSSMSDIDIKVLNGKHGEHYHLSKYLLGIIFYEPEVAFLNLWEKMPFGSFVFRKELLNKSLLKKYLDTSHAYTGIIWEAINDKFITTKKITIACGVLPLIIFKNEIKTWEKDAFKIMYYEIPLWFNLLSNKYPVIINEKILDNYLNKMSKIQYLLYYKSQYDNFKNNIELYMSFFSKHQKNKAHLIALIPNIIANLMYKLFMLIKKILICIHLK